MNGQKMGMILGTIAVVFALPLVSAYGIEEFENSENTAESVPVEKAESNFVDGFIEILTKIDTSLMSFFADLRQTYLYSS